MKSKPHYHAANLRQQVAWNIHHMRRLLGWTQRELAKKIDMSFSLIQKYEMGLAAPSIDVLERLSMVFRLPPPMLLCDLQQLTKEDLLLQMQQDHD